MSAPTLLGYVGAVSGATISVRQFEESRQVSRSSEDELIELARWGVLSESRRATTIYTASSPTLGRVQHLRRLGTRQLAVSDG